MTAPLPVVVALARRRPYILLRAWIEPDVVGGPDIGTTGCGYSRERLPLLISSAMLSRASASNVCPRTALTCFFERNRSLPRACGLATAALLPVVVDLAQIWLYIAIHAYRFPDVVGSAGVGTTGCGYPRERLPRLF